MSNEENIVEFTVQPKIIGIDEAQHKAEKLIETINSAKSLVVELAELCQNMKVTASVD